MTGRHATDNEWFSRRRDPERLRDNIVLSGGGQMTGLNERVEDGLASIGGAKVTVCEDPIYAGAHPGTRRLVSRC